MVLTSTKDVSEWKLIVAVIIMALLSILHCFLDFSFFFLTKKKKLLF
jgi:hypothetical protein